jgi:hypothetical protein
MKISRNLKQDVSLTKTDNIFKKFNFLIESCKAVKEDHDKMLESINKHSKTQQEVLSFLKISKKSSPPSNLPSSNDEISKVSDSIICVFNFNVFNLFSNLIFLL